MKINDKIIKIQLISFINLKMYEMAFIRFSLNIKIQEVYENRIFVMT